MRENVRNADSIPSEEIIEYHEKVILHHYEKIQKKANLEMYIVLISGLYNNSFL